MAKIREVMRSEEEPELASASVAVEVGEPPEEPIEFRLQVPVIINDTLFHPGVYRTGDYHGFPSLKITKGMMMELLRTNDMRIADFMGRNKRFGNIIVHTPDNSGHGSLKVMSKEQASRELGISWF